MTTENIEQNPEPDEVEETVQPAPVAAAKPPVVPAPEDNGFVKPEDVMKILDAANAERDAADAAAETITIEAPLSAKYQSAAEEYRQDAEAVARASGIPMHEMHVLFNFVADGAVAAAEMDAAGGLAQGQIPGPDLANRQACETTLYRRFGTLTPKIVADAAAAFKALPEDVRRWLDHDNGDGRLLTNHPDLVVALALKKNGFTKLSPSAAEAELTALRGQKLDALGLAKKKMLAYIAASGKSRDAKLPAAKPAKVAPSGRANLESELRSLRLDPGYMDKSRPNHKQILARVQAIHAELSPERA